MGGVWSSLIILRVVVVVVVVVEAVIVDVAEVRTWSAMNVVNLVILLENVACGLVHEAWEVDGVEALALVLVGVQVMGAGISWLYFVFFFFVINCTCYRVLHYQVIEMPWSLFCFPLYVKLYRIKFFGIWSITVWNTFFMVELEKSWLSETPMLNPLHVLCNWKFFRSSEPCYLTVGIIWLSSCVCYWWLTAEPH